MNALNRYQRQSQAIRVLNWMARLTSVASIAILTAFAFGGHESGTPTLREGIALAFFPAGVALGILLGWWRPLLGGGLSVVSLAVFYGWIGISSGHFAGGPYFLVFALPGVLFLLCGLAQQRLVQRWA